MLQNIVFHYRDCWDTLIRHTSTHLGPWYSYLPHNQVLFPITHIFFCITKPVKVHMSMYIILTDLGCLGNSFTTKVFQKPFSIFHAYMDKSTVLLPCYCAVVCVYVKQVLSWWANWSDELLNGLVRRKVVRWDAVLLIVFSFFYNQINSLM